MNDSLAEIKQPKELIDPTLKEGIRKFIKETNYKEKYPEIPISETCILLYSHIDPDKTITYFPDSTIKMAYIGESKSNPTYKYDSYKGFLHLEGYNIVVFDFGYFIDKYINIDSLNPEPLKSLKGYPTKDIELYVLNIKEDKLYDGGPMTIVSL